MPFSVIFLLFQIVSILHYTCLQGWNKEVYNIYYCLDQVKLSCDIRNLDLHFNILKLSIFPPWRSSNSASTDIYFNTLTN